MACRHAMQRHQEGGALPFVLIIAAVLAFLASMGMMVSLSGRRAATQSTLRRAAFFCAEAALERARGVLGATANLTALLNANLWPSAQACPPGGPPGLTYQALVRDNVDDGPPSNNAVDTDGTVIVDAEASLDGMAMARVSGLVQVTPGQQMLHDYKTQDRLGARRAGDW